MPRPASGSIESHEWKDGRTVSWWLRVRASGQRYRVDLGTNHEGWGEERAQVELDKALEQVRRGNWVPPGKEAPADPGPSGAGEAADSEETIRHTLSRFWGRKKREVASNTRNDYRWRIDLILAFRHETRTAEIDERWVDELRDWLAAQPCKGRNDGKTLAPSSVNKVLTILAQALDLAVDHKALDHNPARGKRRKMREPKSKGAFLEPDMVIDLLDVAGDWEEELGKRKRPGQCYGRRSLIAALCLSGPRISETVDADSGHFDLA